MATSTKKTPLLSLIILNYQTSQLVLNLLGQLGHHPQIEIIVVDNSPHTELKKPLIGRFPYVNYLFPGRNLGFAAGNNLGVNHAKGQWLGLLNSDTLTTSRNLLYLLKLANQYQAQVIAPQLVHPDGKIQPSAGYYDSFFRHPLNWLFMRPRFIQYSGIKSSAWVDFAIGAALFIKPEVWQLVGSLDDHYFMYFEDLDFCYRLHLYKIPILYCPQVRVTHYGGRSADQNTYANASNYRYALQYYLTKWRGPVIAKINQQLPILR